MGSGEPMLLGALRALGSLLLPGQALVVPMPQGGVVRDTKCLGKGRLCATMDLLTPCA